jgi:transcriptional regulator with XRE-family HTH domain
MAVEIEAKGRFGKELAHLVGQKNMTLRDLAGAIDSTYEHMRKLVRGLAYPSKYLRDAIAKTLGVSGDDLQKLIDMDKMESKFGANLHAQLGTNSQAEKYLGDIRHVPDVEWERVRAQFLALEKFYKQQAKQQAQAHR